MKKLNLAVVVCMALAGSWSATGGTVIYDTTGLEQDGLFSVQVNSPLFDSFSTGTNSGPISSVEFVLQGTSDGGTITVELYSDDADTPGAFVAILGTIDDTSLTSSNSIVSVSLSSNPVLAMGTRYWIGLFSSTTSANASFTDGSGGVGTAGEFYSLAGPDPGVFPDSVGGEIQAQVAVGAPSAGTPEAGTLFLFATGLAAFLMFGSRIPGRVPRELLK